MAKKQTKADERMLYCSGPNWEGDGSRDSSACKFNHSQLSTAKRYKCHCCATGLSPSHIHADHTGVRVKRSEAVDAASDKPLSSITEEVANQLPPQPVQDLAIEDSSPPAPPAKKVSTEAKRKKKKRPRRF